MILVCSSTLVHFREEDINEKLDPVNGTLQENITFAPLEIVDSLFYVLTSILISLSILDGVAHSEEPEFPGRASSFHSGVASLKQISPKQRQVLTNFKKCCKGIIFSISQF